MAKRMTKAESTAIAILAIIAIPIYAAAKLIEATGWVPIVLVVGAAIAGWFWYQYDKKKKRLAYLREKYQDEDLVEKIFEGYFWQGQSESQLQDSLGEPEAVDRKVLKTKTKEIWKYNHQGANRYALRITVENGEVIGWDKKT